MASAASFIFREMVRLGVKYVCLTYCWVMVDAPSKLPDPRTSHRNARTMLTGSMAPSVKKWRSSVDTTASITTAGTWESGTLTRFCSESVGQHVAAVVVDEGRLLERLRARQWYPGQVVQTSRDGREAE